jgi:hypothetical protein
VGHKEVYVITLVFRTIPIKNSVNSLFSESVAEWHDSDAQEEEGCHPGE